jgi:hypothetical protein
VAGGDDGGVAGGCSRAGGVGLGVGSGEEKPPAVEDGVVEPDEPMPETSVRRLSTPPASCTCSHAPAAMTAARMTPM